jgi:hypothetical protein
MDLQEKKELLEFFMMMEGPKRPRPKMADYSKTERVEQAKKVAKKAMVGTGILAVLAAGKRGAISGFDASKKVIGTRTHEISRPGYYKKVTGPIRSKGTAMGGISGAIWGAATLGIVLYLVYKYLIDSCKRGCISSTDPDCYKICRIKKTEVIISKLKQELSGCAKTQNPEKCKKKIESYIAKYKAKIQELQAG